VSLRVAGCLDNVKLVAAKSDPIAIRQEAIDLQRNLIAPTQAEIAPVEFDARTGGGAQVRRVASMVLMRVRQDNPFDPVDAEPFERSQHGHAAIIAAGIDQ
jgi:hypothetical protein